MKLFSTFWKFKIEITIIIVEVEPFNITLGIIFLKIRKNIIEVKKLIKNIKKSLQVNFTRNSNMRSETVSDIWVDYITAV